MNRAQLAAALGIARTTVDAWVQRGCPVHKPAKAKGSPAAFDVGRVLRWKLQDACRRAWDPHLRPTPLG
jgi:phage terminase Nu1 subunit (DNA packaging protein)